MKKRTLLIIMAVVFATLTWTSGLAQTAQIGSGNETSSYIPIDASAYYSYTQAIYTSTELNQSGITSDQAITKIRYRLKSEPGSNSDDWTIFLGNTSKTGFESTTDWISANDMTAVFSGTVSFPANDDWMEITLFTPFVYTGDNLVVAVKEGAMGLGNFGDHWYGYTATENSGLYFYSYTVDPDPFAPPISGNFFGRTGILPQMQFDYQPYIICSGSPAPGTAFLSPSSGNAGSEFMAFATGTTFGPGMEYQWQKNMGGWQDISGATSLNSIIIAESGTPGTTTDYRLKVTCTNSGQTNYTDPVSFQTVLMYCTPIGSVNNTNEIRNFTLSNLSNNSGIEEGTAGYSDYTETVAPANIEALMEYTASLTSGNGTGTNGAAIWIDYNNNGTFEESEKVAWIPNGIGASMTVNFPEFMVENHQGLRRLRIQYHYSKSGEDLDSCLATSPYSETEDYMVNILPPPSCVPPVNLTANVTYTSANLLWTSDGNLFDIEWDEGTFAQGSGSNTISGVSNPHTLSGLSSNTTYSYYVRQDCGANGYSDWSGPYTFYTGYCVATGTVNSYRITGVSTNGGYENISNLNNGTANSYSDYSAMTVIQSPGETINYTITVPSTTGIKIWIDLNGDLTFDETELVASHTTVSTAGIWTGAITLPEDLPLGDYRMRIRSGYYYFPEQIYPCGVNYGNYGEAEDYTLSVIATPTCLQVEDFIASNVTDSSADFTWTPRSGESNWIVRYGVLATFDMDDSNTYNEEFVSGTASLSVNNLTANSYYTVAILADCSGGDTSYWEYFSFKNAYCLPITSNSEYLGSLTTNGAVTDISYTASSQPNDGSKGYGNALHLVIEANAGQEFDISTVYAGVGSNGLNVWVDWNKDFEFDHAAPELIGGLQNGNVAKTVTVQIPTDIPNGEYRMRARNAWNVFPTPCGSINYGSGVDFTLRIVDPPSCLVPTMLEAADITPDSARLSWTAGDTETKWNIRYGELDTFDMDNSNTYESHTVMTNTEYLIDGELDSSTKYVFVVQADCGTQDGTSEWSDPYTFSTKCLPPDVTGITDGEVCGEGEVTLSATTNGNTLFWYDTETGGVKLHEGNTFVTPWITETTSYWVAAFEGTSGSGARTSTTATSSFAAANYGLIFEADESFTLNTVDVYLADIASDLTVNLIDDDGTVLNTKTIALPTGSTSSPILHTIVLDFDIEPGTYSLIAASATALVIEISAGGFPYAIGDVGEVTYGYHAGSASTNYFYFYNWTYSAGCGSARTEVVATVNDAPDFELSDDALTICEGDTTDEVTVAVGSEDYDTYNWTPSTGVSGNVTTGWTFSPSESTTYVLEAGQSTGDGCTTIVEVDITVTPLPMPITVEASATEITTDDIAALWVTGNSIGGTAVLGTATTASQNFPNPFYSLYGGVKSQFLFTADELSAQGMVLGSTISEVSFYLDSAAGRDNVDFTIRMGATTETEMINSFIEGTTTVYGPQTFSPSTNGSGLATFTLSTPYVWDGTSNLIVEAGHNNGDSGYFSGFTSIRYTETTFSSAYHAVKSGVSGGMAGFDDETSFATSATSKNRPNMIFTHSLEQADISWSPVDNLYTDAAATTAYVADSYAETVYFKPVAAGSVTYTATSHVDGCTASNSIQIDVSQVALDGYVYEDGAWMPEHPSGVSDDTDNIWVVNGSATGVDALADTNANNVTVMAGASLDVKGVLNVSGDLTIDGDLVFLSGENFDGELGVIGGDIMGHAIVHRYFSNNRAFRMVSSPVTTSESINANWQEGTNNPNTQTNLDPNPGYGIHITGSQTGANGFDATELGTPSMYIANVASQQFNPIASTTGSSLNAGDAYLLFVRGNRSVDLNNNDASSSTVLRTKGELATGDQPQAFTSPAAASFIMSGNPYQSAVDFYQVLTASTNVIPYYYFGYDPTIGDQGSYVTVVMHPLTGEGMNTSSSMFNEYLQPGQAVQIMVLDPGPVSIAYTEASKAPGNHTQTNMMDTRLSGDNMLTVQLYTTENFNNGGPVHDSFGVLFDPSFDNALTVMDAIKPMNFYENLGIDHEGTYLSIEYREMPQANDVYSIYSEGYTHTHYTFKTIVDGLENYALYLDDHYNGTSTYLGQGEVSYNFVVSSDPMSRASDRFSIRVEENFLGITDNLFYGVSLFPNPLEGNTFYIGMPQVERGQIPIYITDISGRTIFRDTLDVVDGRISIKVNDGLASGVYLVNLKIGESERTLKLVKE